ncbi:hypothetical protein MMC2321_00757 [Chitinophaga sp. MM2321]
MENVVENQYITDDYAHKKGSSLRTAFQSFYLFLVVPDFKLGGDGGNRTRVQTYSPKAFYMLIYALVCRNLAGA